MVLRVVLDNPVLTLTTHSAHLDKHESPLAWVSRILWPDGSARLEPGGDRSLWASPSVGTAKILVPVQPVAAGRAVRRYHDGLSVGSRLRSVVAEGLMSLRPVSRTLLRPHVVGVVGEAGGGIPDELARLVGIPDLLFAISLSHPKSNRKPVLQLLDPAGDCHGWAKVGWDEWTRDLVGNEAVWLSLIHI